MNFNPTDEQLKVLEYAGKDMIVSASAGSGKTSTLVEFVARKILDGQSLKRIMLLTFTKASASEMKERLTEKLLEYSNNENALNALDDISTADISTIHAFLEKIIKRNLNFLEIDSGFRVLSQDEILDLKKQAFEQSEKKYKELYFEKYEDLYFRLHNDRKLVFEILDEMLEFFASQFGVKEKIEYFKNNQKQIFEKSIAFLINSFSKRGEIVSNELKVLKERFAEEKYKEYCQNLINLFSFNLDGLENLRIIAKADFKSPPLSKKVDELLLEELKTIYSQAKSIRDELIKLKITDDRIYKPEKFGEIEIVFYQLFEVYKREYENLKLSEGAVDFNDLERFALKILSNSNVKLEIENNYDYIFIDEYQDTNRVQEHILKSIVGKSHFIAVGDPKQSIYGFRNATSEIIKEDIKLFSEREDSSAEFLRQNFRSDPYILNFVNNVFEDVMTEENVGIDYKSTSMLKAGDSSSFVRDESLPSVRIDLVDFVDEETNDEQQVVYDITKDEDIKISLKNNQAKVIALRINELMLKKIYDGKTKTLRNITYKDIVILTRGKGDLVEELMRQLPLSGIPIVSEVKDNLKNHSEILAIVNLFKIMLDFQDDVALISVMLSKLGGFDVDELARLRLGSDKKEFYEIIKSSKDKKVVEFLERLKRLRFEFEVYGAYIMLEKLFEQCDFRLYLSSKENGENELFILNKFLQLVKSSGFDFDLASLVKFLEQDSLDYKGGTSSANAVSIRTIHSSKGLEFPIVIFADAGKALIGTYKKNYIINEEYGLALNFFAREDDEIFKSPTLYMIKEIERKKDLTDEIMLLYVALTRAKNHLYIVGEFGKEQLSTQMENPYFAKSALQMFLSGYKELRKTDSQVLKENRVEVNHVQCVEDVMPNTKKEYFVSDEREVEKIKKYFSFEYPHKDSTKTIYKNSVSSLNQGHKIEVVGHDDNDFVERGNAYHLALKEIDFWSVENTLDIENRFAENKDLKNVEGLIDKNILLNNINILKNLLNQEDKIFKEQQFTSLVNKAELGIDEYDENIMIQGIVDLFSIGKDNILIDYKFTNATDENVLKERYKKQLILYKNAIENAYKIKLNKIYLLSLKNSKIIEF